MITPSRLFLNWLERPGYHVHVKSAYDLGGYDIIPNASIGLDDYGLEFVRTFNLRHRYNQIEYRFVDPRDLHLIVSNENFPAPSPEILRKMYGNMPFYTEGKGKK